MRRRSNKGFSARAGFFPLKELISQTVKELGLSENLIAWQAVLRWKEIVGEKVAKYAKALAVKDGVLYIFCPNPTWRTQLILMKKEITNKANQVVARYAGEKGKELIRDVKFLRSEKI